jgi:hypothetical protein
MINNIPAATMGYLSKDSFWGVFIIRIVIVGGLVLLGLWPEESLPNQIK